eukprot:428314-Prorocentrum_minimum.AAC.1
MAATFVFVMPPSVEELERRLRGRGTEKEESIQKRLKNAAGYIPPPPVGIGPRPGNMPPRPVRSVPDFFFFFFFFRRIGPKFFSFPTTRHREGVHSEEAPEHCRVYILLPPAPLVPAPGICPLP